MQHLYQPHAGDVDDNVMVDDVEYVDVTVVVVVAAVVDNDNFLFMIMIVCTDTCLLQRLI